MKTRAQVLILLTALLQGAALAADPPTTMNYQGVLRDAADRPRTGTFDLVFRFFDAQTSGNEILGDPHTAGWGNAVAVTNGLFNVHLGEGAVFDGSGPGTYTSLGSMFRDYSDVWMELTIGVETLSPRVKIQASAYALNSGSLGGKSASSLLDTSSTAQTKSGPLIVTSTYWDAVTGTNSSNGAVGVLGGLDAAVMAYGGPIGGFFYNSWGSQATLANYAEGVQAVGQTTGGSFANSAGKFGATLASGNTGIAAFGTSRSDVWSPGPERAGYFEDPAYTGRAELAMGSFGVTAIGAYNAGRFVADIGGYHADLASDYWNAAGYFSAPLAGVFTKVADVFGLGLVTNGPKAFLQNHPSDPSRLMAYLALEGPEAGTYTRGSGSIRAGEARIVLDPTFALTTDPDIGLTAVVTPRRPRADLYVASVSTKELVVRSGAASAGDVAFDYVVNGLRLGFENQPVILESDAFSNATVPSLEASAARLAALPEDSRGSTPLARLAAERARSGTDAPELAGARALIAGINSAEHALHARATGAGQGSIRQPEAGVPAGPPFGFSMPVEMEVQPGDVLSNDLAVPGSLRIAEEAGDPAVVGVVVGHAGDRFRDQAPLALAGTVVPCNVDASYRPIVVGDLLVASPTPGFAMSAETDPRQGTVIGKALEPLAAGTGSIRILVMSR